MPSKNCNFCNFSKNYEKLEKSQFLLKLLNSSGKGDRGCVMIYVKIVGSKMRVLFPGTGSVYSIT